MISFIPLFFFASMYAQISLGESASETRPLPADLLRRLRDRHAVGRQDPRQSGAPGRRWSPGCAIAAVGFALWAHALPDLSVGDQWHYIVMAGAGVGLVLSPANTDALNRVPRDRYGEATGITQTVRNFGSSLGLAVLGTVLILAEQVEPRVDAGGRGVPKARPTRSPTRSASPAAATKRLRRTQRRAGEGDLRRRPARLRPRLADGLLRDGRGDGGRLRRRR